MENNEEFDFNKGRNGNRFKFTMMISLIFVWFAVTVAGTYAISSVVSEWFDPTIRGLPYMDDNSEVFLK